MMKINKTVIVASIILLSAFSCTSRVNEVKRINYTWSTAALVFPSTTGKDINIADDAYIIRVENNSDIPISIKCSDDDKNTLFSLVLFAGDSVKRVPLICRKSSVSEISPGNSSEILLHSMYLAKRSGSDEAEISSNMNKMWSQAMICYSDKEIVCFNKAPDFKPCTGKVDLKDECINHILELAGKELH